MIRDPKDKSMAEVLADAISVTQEIIQRGEDLAVERMERQFRLVIPPTRRERLRKYLSGWLHKVAERISESPDEEDDW